MKRTINLLMSSLCIFGASLSAADWGPQGLTVINSQKDSAEITTDTLQDKDKNEFTVTYNGDLTESNMRSVVKLNSEFRTWKNLQVNTIKFSVANDEIQIFVSPISYTYKNVNIMDYLSSGILFSYKVNLMYNFRVLVEKLFVPIRGIYIDEKSFSDKIISAIKDPITYINARDPEYLLEKLDKLTIATERHRNATLSNMNFGRPVDKEVIDKVIEIKSKNPTYTYKDIFEQINKEKQLKTSPGIVRDILIVYFNEY